MTKAGVKVGDRAVEEIAEKGRPDGPAALCKGGLSDRSTAKVAEEVVELHSGGLAHQLQDEGHGATKGQRAGANEVPMGLIDVLGTLLRIRSGKTRKRERKRVRAWVIPKIGSRLMP